MGSSADFPTYVEAGRLLEVRFRQLLAQRAQDGRARPRQLPLPSSTQTKRAEQTARKRTTTPALIRKRSKHFLLFDFFFEKFSIFF